MKVLFCSPYLDAPGVVSGGITRWGKYIISYYNGYGKDDVELVPSSFDRHLYLCSGDVPTWKRILSGIKEQGAAVRQAKKLMKKEHPDVVHICTSASLGLIKDMMLIKAAKKLGAKAVVHIHFGKTPDLLKGGNWESKLIRKVLVSCDAAIAMNMPTYQALLDNGYKNAKYLPNPLPLSIISQVKELEGRIERVPNRILYVGNVARHKGVYELVEACSKIEGINLRIVGKCPEAYKAALMQIASQKPVLSLVEGDEPSWIEFVGDVSHEQVLREFFEASIFAFPSYSEGFPNVILEAMACGCPIASSNVGAITEMLDIDGDPCGICYEPRSTEAVLNAILSLLHHDELCKQFAEKAKVRVNEMYAIPKVWQQMVKIWKEVVDDDVDVDF